MYLSVLGRLFLFVFLKAVKISVHLQEKGFRLHGRTWQTGATGE